MEIELKVIIFSVLNFALLAFLLTKFLYKPVRKMLDSRQAMINDALDQAEAAREEVAATGETIKADMAKARLEAEAILEAARKQGEQDKAAIIEEARAQADSFIETARQQIADEKDQAVLELRTQITDLAIMIAEKALNGKLTVEQEQALIANYTEEAGK